MDADGNITFTVLVKNTGSRDGKETVQLYISDKESSLPRPVKELKRFKKVDLKAGESQSVSFTISKEELSFYDDTKHEWIAEPGKFEALVGASSTDIRSKILFELK